MLDLHRNLVLLNESYFKYCVLIQKSVNKEIRLQLIYCDGMKISRERVFMIRVNTEISDKYCIRAK
jgi:hypothetical protein